jgi:hypothetical protein
MPHATRKRATPQDLTTTAFNVGGAGRVGRARLSTTGSARRSRCLRDCEPECLHRFHTVPQFEFVTDLPMGQTRLTGVQFAIYAVLVTG